MCLSGVTATGMSKIVINHLDKLFVTSDSNTIVTELDVYHPAAKIVAMAAKAQQQEIGDGTNTVCHKKLSHPVAGRKSEVTGDFAGRRAAQSGRESTSGWTARLGSGRRLQESSKESARKNRPVLSSLHLKLSYRLWRCSSLSCYLNRVTAMFETKRRCPKRKTESGPITVVSCWCRWQVCCGQVCQVNRVDMNLCCVHWWLRHVSMSVPRIRTTLMWTMFACAN